MNPVQKKKKRTRAAKRSPNFDDSIKNTAREKLSRMCDRNPQQTSFHPLTLQVIGTRAGAGVDSVWEQEKLEARKMLENAAESHTSGARFVCDPFARNCIARYKG